MSALDKLLGRTPQAELIEQPQSINPLALMGRLFANPQALAGIAEVADNIVKDIRLQIDRIESQNLQIIANQQLILEKLENVGSNAKRGRVKPGDGGNGTDIAN